MAVMETISGTALVTTLETAAAVRAAWADLIQAARDGDDDAMLWGAECLEAQLKARGAPGDHMLSEAVLELIGRHPVGDIGPVPSVELRVSRSEQLLARDAETGRCVAWLTYDEAMLAHFPATYGPITFFDADWCLPNAIRDDGHPFEFRDELRALAADGLDWDFDGENWKPDRSRRPYIVLARVDLGERRSAGALELAVERVQLMLDVARLQGGGRQWRRSGPAVLVVDGKVGMRSFGRHEVRAGDPSETYGRRAFAESLDEHGPLVGQMLSGPIPTDLAEAIRMLGEAGQVEDPRRDRARERTIDLRTVVALHDSAHDHLATYARYASDDLGGRMLDDWSHMGWRLELVKAIDACLSWDGDASGDLGASIRKDGAHHLDIAADHLDELLAAAPDDHTRRTAARWLSSIDDAQAHLALLATLSSEGELLAGRTARVRNGIAHGTPPSPEVTEAVLGYSRFRVFRALNYAMIAATSSRPMKEVLDEEEHRRSDELTALTSGTSMLQQWRNRAAE